MKTHLTTYAYFFIIFFHISYIVIGYFIFSFCLFIFHMYIVLKLSEQICQLIHYLIYAHVQSGTINQPLFKSINEINFKVYVVVVNTTQI